MRTPRWLPALVTLAVTTTLAELVLLSTPAAADTVPKTTWPATQTTYFRPADSFNARTDAELRLATLGTRFGVSLVNFETGASREVVTDHDSPGYDHGVISADGSTVVIQAGAQTNYPHTNNHLYVLRGFDPDTLSGGTLTEYTSMPTDRDMNSLAISHDGSRLAFGGQGVTIVDTHNGELTEVVPPVDCPYNENQPFDWIHVALSGDGNTLGAYVGKNCNNGVNQARVYDITDLGSPSLLWSHDQDGQPFPFACSPTDRKTPIALSDDGSTLAVSDLRPGTPNHWLGKVVVRDLASGEEQTFFEDQGRVCSIALSADGSRLAAEVGDPRYVGEYQGSDSWGQSVYVTDTTPDATPVLLAERTIPNGGTSYTDYGWGLNGISADGTAVAFSGHGWSGSYYTKEWIARDPDAVPLAWPAGAALTAPQVGQTFVTLDWPAATGSVSSYRLTGGPGGPVDLPADQTEATVSGLSPATGYHFEVRARNGGSSTDPLTLDATTSEPAGPGSAALSVSVTADDTVALQWDPKAGAEGYQVLRATGSGPVTPVADLGADTQWTDETTDGATAYTYRVASVTGGTAAPHTVDKTVTTAPVAITSASAIATQSLGHVVPGQPVTVHAVGQPHRQATATLTLQGTAPPAAVGLTETTPGKYDGTITLPTGATQLSGVAVTLADAVGTGAGHTAAATANLGLPVGVALKAHLTTSGFLGRIVTSSASGGWSLSTPVNLTSDADRTVGVPPASDISVSYLRVSDGRSFGGGPLVSATAGQVVDLPSRTLSEPATAHLDGGSGAAGAVIDVAQGGTSQQVRLNDAGKATASGLSAGPVTLSLVTSDPGAWRFEPMSPVTTSLQVGANDVDVPVQPRAAATLSGTITPPASGVQLAGVSVRVVQQLGASSVTRNGISDAEGHYAVSGLVAGLPTTVSVSSSLVRTTGDLPVSMHAGANPLDIQVEAIAGYFVSPSIVFKDAEGDTTTEPLDWRVATHFGVYIDAPTGSVGPSSFSTGGTVSVRGQPGDVIQLCADGRYEGYDRACANATLPASTAVGVDLAVTLSAAGRTKVDVSLRDSSGQSDADREVRVVATRGADVVVADLPVDDATFSVPSGTWDVTVVDPQTSQLLADLPARALTGPSQSLGTVQLHAEPPYAGSGNGLAAQPQSVSPGGSIDLTASWSPGSAQPAGGLAFELPPSVSVPDPAVAATVNGLPVTASLVGQTLTVPVPATAADGTGHATLHLDVAPDADADYVVVRAAISGHDLGVAVVEVPAVTLVAPRRVASSTLPLSGRARAGAEVSVYADGLLVGTATSSATGAWRTTVTLPAGRRHTLLATIQNASTAPVAVEVDPLAPDFQTVTVTQENVRSYTREPGASYPFVVVPYQPMTVSTTLADSSRLAGIDAVLDGVHHAMTRSGDTWSATFLPAYPRGAITFEYVEAERPTDRTVAQVSPPRPSLDAYLNSLTPAEAAAIGTPTVTVNGAGDDATITTDVGSVHLTTFDATGTPTTGLRQVAQGVWALDDPTISVAGDHVSGTVSLLVDDTAQGRAPAMAAAGGGTAKRLELAWDVFENGSGLKDAFGTGEKYDKLNELLDRATGCSQGSFNKFKPQIDELLKEAIAIDVATVGLEIAGAALAPETFGVGTIALWGAGELMQWLMDEHLEKLEDFIAQDMDNDDSCPPKPPNPGGGGGGGGSSGPGGPGGSGGANPFWIYDPSGVITDGVEPIAGATVTLTRSNTEPGPYSVWDAATYEQVNDLVTGADGAYGWNVPEGWYVVNASAPGRVPAASAPLEVLPPRTGVDLVLGPEQLPSVAEATAEGTVVTVRFDGWMKAAFLTESQLSLTDADGEPVASTINPIGLRTGTDGDSYVKAVALTIAAPPADTTLTVTVGAGVQDVLGRPMAADFSGAVTVPGPPPPPPPPSGPSAECTRAQQAAANAAAAVVTATAAVTAATKALTKATAKLKKLKKAHAAAKKVKAAKKKVKAAKKKVKSARAALGAATAASAGAAASAAAACH